MSFDALAPHYRWMEWVLAGGKLQRCRTTFLDGVRDARDVLLLGEGNGRFLKAFAQINHVSRITVLDASAIMLQQAQKRLAQVASPRGGNRIQYLQADVFAWSPPPRRFDLIVSNFFFDCFRPDQLAQLIPRLAASADAGGRWIISDFCLPDRGLARWRARGIIAAMYCFFRFVTKLPARSITPLNPSLEASGFRLLATRRTEWGLLHTDLWQRC